MARNLIEKGLDELYKEAAAGESRGKSISKYRTAVAYALKGVAAGGSLFIATGLLPNLHQGVGIAVLVAVFLDTLTSNHKRLIAEVEAGYAYRAIRYKVKREFNREASPLYAKIDQGDKAAELRIDELMKTAHKSLSDEIARIEEFKKNANVDALKSLSLDQERSGLN